MLNVWALNKQLKVAKIIDQYSVVLNQGSQNGINVGDVFEIYITGDQVKDPDTGEELGTLTLTKGSVTAKTVSEKMTICYSSDYMSAIAAGLAATMVGKPVSLNVAPEEISGGFSEDDKIIHVGDFVRKITSSNKE